MSTENPPRAKISQKEKPQEKTNLQLTYYEEMYTLTEKARKQRSRAGKNSSKSKHRTTSYYSKLGKAGWKKMIENQLEKKLREESGKPVAK